jgi:hypothetical protein
MTGSTDLTHDKIITSNVYGKCMCLMVCVVYKKIFGVFFFF